MPLDTRCVELMSLVAYVHLRGGRPQWSVELLEALQVLQPKNAWVPRTLAYAYLLAADYQACLRQIERCPGDDKGLQLIRGRALWALGRQDEAREVVAQLSGNLRGMGR